MSAFWSPWSRGVFGDGALWVLIGSLLDRIGPVGYRLSGVRRGCGGWLHLSTHNFDIMVWFKKELRVVCSIYS